jgi:LuxR family maltose regulon positive regulatory protein
MDMPLLETKLFIPPSRPDLVSRPHLIGRLSEGRHRKLTLISAPAGFGKTTLVSDWLRQIDLSAAWLSLDEGDNDLTRFLTYLISALGTVQGEIQVDVQMLLQAPQPPPLETTMTMLINRLAGVPVQFVMVLDDYHVIKQQSIHQALAFLLDHLPPQLHLVIASRADPPLPLSRWRGGGQLTELREADLRFLPEETATFLNEMNGLNLSTAQVKALASRTEGWITGLLLAALSMHEHEDIAGFVTDFTGSHRYILDYLTDEVLRRQPEAVQHFLCQTSILDRLSSPLCDAVLGRAAGEQESPGENLPSAPLPTGSLATVSSQQILEYLEAANLFIIPLDDRRQWYRYHRLFADFLRSRLQQNMSDQVPELQGRASEWYEQQGWLAAAIDHALAGNNDERAAYLIEKSADVILMRSEVTTLQRWIETLPDKLVRTRPLLCIYHAITLVLGGSSLESAMGRLQAAIEVDEAGADSGGVIAFRAWLAALQGNTRQAIELSQEALQLLPENNLFLRSLVSASVGLAYFLNGEIEPAFQAFSEVSSIGRKTGNVMLTVIALRRLAEIRLTQGRLNQARAYFEQALALACDGQGRPQPIGGLALVGLGWLRLEGNDLEGATQYLTVGSTLTGKWSEVAGLQGYIGLAQAKQAQADSTGANQAIQRARQLALKLDVTEMDDILVGAYQARLWLAQGNLEATQNWVEERGLTRSGVERTDREAGHTALSFLRVFEYIPLARLYMARRQFDQALAVLTPLLQRVEQAGWMWFGLEIMILQAIAYQYRGDTNQALAVLERALTLAEPEGYVRTFIDNGPPIDELLRQAAARGIAVDYVGTLLEAFDNRERPPSHRDATALIEPLSERELEVLRLLAAGLSNKEIANTLIITVGTVKKHINNIYGKLEVHRRTEAVARARDLDIL